MRSRTAWLVIGAVNVLWAAAFFGYTQQSKTPVVRGGEIVRAQTPATGEVKAVNTPIAQSTPAQAPAAKPDASKIATSNIPSPQVVTTGREFGWQDVTNETYAGYLTRLKQAGCPEKQIRNIVIADVNELFDKRRLEHAIKTDTRWWKGENIFGSLPMQSMLSANFDQERRQILDKLLGETWDRDLKLPPINSQGVNLTGPVLGALPTDTWNNVQEICSSSMERANKYQMERITEGKPLEPVEMAKLRNYTRTELAKILTPEQMEEFLLRFSHNSSNLRRDLGWLDVTPDEFRKVFRAIDPLEHQIQLDYGGLEALSQKQREQYEAQRERAIREALAPQRFEQYQLTKDPVYKQAQLTATQYGMSAKAIQPIYEMQKAMESKRLQVSQNPALTPEQKAAAFQSLAIEQQQVLQKLMTDATLR